jgi:hypothetical protein
VDHDRVVIAISEGARGTQGGIVGGLEGVRGDGGGDEFVAGEFRQETLGSS